MRYVQSEREIVVVVCSVSLTHFYYENVFLCSHMIYQIRRQLGDVQIVQHLIALHQENVNGVLYCSNVIWRKNKDCHGV